MCQQSVLTIARAWIQQRPGQEAIGISPSALDLELSHDAAGASHLKQLQRSQLSCTQKREGDGFTQDLATPVSMQQHSVLPIRHIIVLISE